MTRRASFMVAYLLMGALGTGVEAQLPVRFQVAGGSVLELFGSALDSVGDVNGDGCDDFIVGAPNADVNASFSGSAFVYSGLDGSILHAFHGSSFAEALGQSVAGVGDMDGDGIPDFGFGIPGGNNFQGLAEIRSGADGSLIHSLTAFPMGVIGRAMAGAGDVNADGVPDVIVGGNGGAVVFSGADGSMIWVFVGSQPGDNFGRHVGGGVDVNADGFDDLMVGALTYNGINGPNAGRVRVYSGATGLPLYTFEGFFGSLLGAVSGLRDINGDGHDEFVVGAPGDGLDTGVVRVHSGADAAVLYQISGTPFPAGGGFGISVADAGDVDGDGIHDFVGGAISDPTGGGDAGMVRVHSGADGSVLLAHFGDPGDRLFVVSSAGDANGDGFDDVLGGAIFADTGGIVDTGSVTVLSVAGTRRYGENLAPTQTLDLDWLPGVGSDPAVGTLTITGAPAGVPGILGVSYEPADITLSGIPIVIDVNPALLFVTMPLTFDATGSASLPVPIRYPFLGGFLARAQAFSVSSQLAASNGLEFRLVE